MINQPIVPEAEPPEWKAEVMFKDTKATFDGLQWQTDDPDLRVKLNKDFTLFDLMKADPAAYFPDFTTAVADFAARSLGGVRINERPDGYRAPGVIY